jgi:hypothetical protein
MTMKRPKELMHERWWFSESIPLLYGLGNVNPLRVNLCSNTVIPVAVLPFWQSPWVEIIGVEVVLRSCDLDGLGGVVAFRRGQQLVRLVRGAIAAMGRRTSVSDSNAILEFRPGRKPLRFEYEQRNWKSIDSLTQGPLSESQAPTEPQRWMNVAFKDDDLADALDLAGSDLDWYDIYKIIECLEHKFGGQKTLLKQTWAPPSLKRLKSAANWPRHRRRQEDAPPHSMSIRDARKEVVDLVRLALERSSSR